MGFIVVGLLWLLMLIAAIVSDDPAYHAAHTVLAGIFWVLVKLEELKTKLL